jgi:hypothetical protein
MTHINFVAFTLKNSEVAKACIRIKYELDGIRPLKCECLTQTSVWHWQMLTGSRQSRFPNQTFLCAGYSTAILEKGKKKKLM